MNARDTDFILASASKARREMLEVAGLNFEICPADLDENAVLEKNADQSGSEKAALLAGAKAVHVSQNIPDTLVIGADQILEFEGQILQKAPDRQAALDKLMNLSGRHHKLISAVAAASGGKILWSHYESAELKMRSLSQEELTAYMDIAGPGLTRCVGAYELEGPGVNLFEEIEGDFFTILGLPLLSLLSYLRQHHQISAF